MTLHDRPRPWYVLNGLCDSYLHIAANGGDLEVLQLLKAIRAIVLNLTIAGVSLTAIASGADPTVIGGLGLIALLAVNGVEISDYLAARQAMAEAQEQAAEDDS